MYYLHVLFVQPRARIWNDGRGQYSDIISSADTACSTLGDVPGTLCLLIKNLRSLEGEL